MLSVTEPEFSLSGSVRRALHLVLDVGGALEEHVAVGRVASQVAVVARVAGGALQDSEVVSAEAIGAHDESNCGGDNKNFSSIQINEIYFNVFLVVNISTTLLVQLCKSGLFQSAFFTQF